MIHITAQMRVLVCEAWQWRQANEMCIRDSLYTEPFDVKINKTIKAIAIASGYPDSDIASKMLSLAHDPHDPNSAQLHQDSVH